LDIRRLSRHVCVRPIGLRRREDSGGRTAAAAPESAPAPQRLSVRVIARAQRAIHCTLAVTDPAAVTVNVHVFALRPPLEQAPDQIASRPFETLSVTDVPVVNDAEPDVPTATLMPAGVDVTRSPLRPVAVTLSDTGCPDGAGGFTV